MFKKRIKNILRRIRNISVKISSKNRFLGRLFFLVTGDFDREFEFTLKGRYDALTHKYSYSNSNANIRRGIHRIEKGLFHAEPRKKFGKDVFAELMNEMSKYDIRNMECNELHWLIATLKAYTPFSYTPEEVKSIIDIAKIELSHKTIKNKLESNESQEFLNFKNTLNKRKSVRFFKSEKANVEKIVQCVEIAKSAPTACNRQPYHIELLTNIKDIRKIGDMAPGTAGWIEGVTTLGVVVGHANSFRFTRDRHLIYFDSGLFVSNFVNSLVTVGLGSCICNWVPNWKEDREAIKYLGYDLSKTVVCLIAIGTPIGIKSPVSVKKTNANILRLRDEY
ncbi:nitroreductase family protein [uncultured Algibacter sp.]|uniref:nitroreductase family protein n=1 Tax=uncultured Algibacter sp. TaxID=298659 RepID=UPI00262DB3A3|nr:nitroreductase family protein [uncultured Algibacter sp.]